MSKLPPMAVFIGQHCSGKAYQVRLAEAKGYTGIICPENGKHPTVLKKVVEGLRAKAPVAIKTHSPYLLDWCKPEEVFVCRVMNGVYKVDCLGGEEFKKRIGNFTLGEYWSFLGEDNLVKGLQEQEEQL